MTAVASGGTVRALARLVLEKRAARRADALRSVPLPTETLHQLAEELAKSSHDDRLLLRGIRRRRADLLPTAAVILATLVDELRLDGITVCDWGLREGVLLGALED